MLSTETGYRRDYDRSPYLAYERSNQLMFDVQRRNPVLEDKALVLGLSIDGRHRAYPFKELAKRGVECFDEEFAGQRLTVVWRASASSALVLDKAGNELPTVLAYWFAWYAFHPDTEIFRAEH